jgi:hypothetical protein
MTSWLDRLAFGPVAAVRPWLLLKATLLLLSLDVWHTHLGPAWRYGAAGFNVAHFTWMNGLPIPTREAYVAMLVTVGVGSFVCALMARPPRALIVLVTFLYTWGWSCSMHDSYQHHYLISLILVGFCFFPLIDSEQMFGRIGGPASRASAQDERGRAKKKGAETLPKVARADAAGVAVLRALPHGPVPRVHAIGYTMVTIVAAVVYVFTAISKSEVEWRDGDALRNITHGGSAIPDVLSLAHAVGMSDDTLFWLMGHSVIGVQLVCALGYLFASSRDGASTLSERTRLTDQLAALHADRARITIALVVIPIASFIAGRIVGALPAVVLFVVATAVALPRSFHRFCFAPLGRPSAHAILAAVALLNAISFHVGAEYIGLQIGWFSWYMIALASIALTPGHWLSALAMALTAGLRTSRSAAGDLSGAESTGLLRRYPVLGPVLGILAAITAVVAGNAVDMPGAFGASVIIAIAAFLAGVFSLTRPNAHALVRGAVASAVAMIVLYASVESGSERYDYYRFAGGDFRRRHRYAEALEAYRAADRYAPEGESRASQIEQMEQMIESGAE